MNALTSECSIVDDVSSIFPFTCSTCIEFMWKSLIYEYITNIKIKITVLSPQRLIVLGDHFLEHSLSLESSIVQSSCRICTPSKYIAQSWEQITRRGVHNESQLILWGFFFFLEAGTRAFVVFVNRRGSHDHQQQGTYCLI